MRHPGHRLRLHHDHPITFARQGKYLPLLVGVPLFINCGFPHCVADSFYGLCTPLSFLRENVGQLIPFYLAIMTGNFIGCNLYRWTLPAPKEEQRATR